MALNNALSQLLLAAAEARCRLIAELAAVRAELAETRRLGPSQRARA